MSHTPGPWGFDKVSGFCFWVDASGTDEDIAELTEPLDTGSGRSRYEANGALIAAAPDLLAALEHVRDCIDEGVDFDMTRILPAITKARGGE